MEPVKGWEDFEVHQSNFVKSREAAIRGIHRTKVEFPQRKIVTCLEGKINDVLIDLRPESPTFKKHVSIELSSDYHYSILIPARIGHSFQTLTKESSVIYQIDRSYNPEEEIGVSPLDPEIAINWKPGWLLSEKDAAAMNLKEINLSLL